MLPSTRPPAIRPSEYSSESAGPFSHDNRLKRSELGTVPARINCRSSETKSSSNISRFAEELNCRSTAPAIVPAAMYAPSGANAVEADLLTPFMYPAITNTCNLSIRVYLCIQIGSYYIHKSENCETRSRFKRNWKQIEEVRENSLSRGLVNFGFVV